MAKLKRKDVVGHRVLLLEDIQTVGGHKFPAGSFMICYQMLGGLGLRADGLAGRPNVPSVTRVPARKVEILELVEPNAKA